MTDAIRSTEGIDNLALTFERLLVDSGWQLNERQAARRLLQDVATQLAYANDAAGKGDNARLAAGGMESEISGLREALSSLLPGLELDLRYASADDDHDALRSRIKTVREALSGFAPEPSGEPVSETDSALQYRWRTESVEFDTRQAYSAVIAALRMGGVNAWPGDGTGMVVQMLENAYRQVAAAKRALVDVATELRDLKAASSGEPSGECKDCDQLMTERDRAEAYADQLADCIEALTGIENGEHSSGNCPWENAIEAAQDGILRVQEMEAIAEVASRVHVAMAADSADEDDEPSSGLHSEYLIMEAEDQLQATLRPWRDRRSSSTKVDNHE